MSTSPASLGHRTPRSVAVDTDHRGPVARTVQHLLTHVAYVISAVVGDDIVSRHIRRATLRLLGADLGPDATLHGGTYYTRPEHLVMGRGSFVNRNCYLDLENRITIGDRVTLGHGVTLITTHHEIGPPEMRCDAHTSDPITIGNGAWIGSNATVLAGVHIGAGAVVAAGALVHRDVAPNTLVGGVPAKVLRHLSATDATHEVYPPPAALVSADARAAIDRRP